MRKIICKKCGTEIDANLGECPVCGTVYYILPDEDKKLDWAMSTDDDIEETQIFKAVEQSISGNGNVHSSNELSSANNDELFNTSVWKTTDDQDETKAINIKPSEKPEPPKMPARRPITTQQRPVQSNGRTTAKEMQAAKEKKQRRNQLVVAAVALVALLTLVLSIMGGLFDFGESNNSGEMENVIGFTQEAATTRLTAMGLEVIIETQESDEIAGTVIDQSIKEGRSVKKGDKVTLTVSLGTSVIGEDGEEYIQVPAITDRTYEDAKQILSTLGLNIEREDDVFSDKDVGIVVTQTPMKGAQLKEGATVRVAVSKGAEPSPSPTAYVITVTAGKGGTISPKGIVNVEDGDDQTFAITPDDGYEIYEVKVDGTDIGAVSRYTFTKVGDDHTIYVVFRQVSDTSPSPSATQKPTPVPTSSPAANDTTSNTDIN